MIRAVGQFELWKLPLRSRPERSRSSSGAKDLARTTALLVRARSLGPLVKARAFGMTPAERGETKLTRYGDPAG